MAQPDSSLALPHRLIEETHNVSPPRSPALPADDGMESLRQSMREIQGLAISTEEKARKMHLLMTRDYRNLHETHLPVRIDDGEDDNNRSVFRLRDTRSSDPSDNPYNVHPVDLEPTYCPGLVPLCDEEDMPEEGGERRALGCQHYTRNVKVQCYDCKLWFPCRHCHDTSTKLPFAHQLNRKMTENMLCMLCKTPQPAGEECMSCGAETAYYYCPKCKLWDNDSTKRIYHCDDCGICRRGEGLGKDYVHCKRCNVCISISTSSAHPCIERATDCDCPLCLEYLFSSPQPVVSLLCGHYMHATCYKDLMTVTYRCPVCNKSAVNMELQWRKLDDEIRLQPMPEEDFEPLSASPPPSRPNSAGPAESAESSESTDQFRQEDQTTSSSGVPAAPETAQSSAPSRRHVPRKVWVSCNDCGGRGWTPFHWLGLRCTVCDGYNTTQTTPLGNASTPALNAVRETYHTQRQHDFTGVEAIRSFGDGSNDSGAAGLGPEQITLLVNDQGADATQHGQDEQHRVDSACGCGNNSHHTHEHDQSDQHGQQQTFEWIHHHDPTQPASRSYFLRASQEEGSNLPSYPSYAGAAAAGLLRPDRALSASASEMFGGVPYEMVMRLGRSLSPMRYYIDGLDLRSDSQTRAAAAEGPANVAVAESTAGSAAAATDDERKGSPDDGDQTPRQKSGETSPKAGHENFWRSERGFLRVWTSDDDEVNAYGEDGDDDDEDDDEDSEDSESDEDEDDDDASALDADEEDDDDDDDEDGPDKLKLPGHL